MRSSAALAVGFAATALGCGLWQMTPFPTMVFWAAPASKTWVHVQHPEYPVSFEMPENYAVPVDRKPSYLGAPRVSGEMVRALRWGIRPVYRGMKTHFAVEVAFLLIDDGLDHVEADAITRLSSGGAAPEDFVGFYRKVFLSGIPNVEFADLRAWRVGQCTGVRLTGTQVGGSPQDPLVSVYRLLLMPLPPAGLLMGKVSFDEEATPEERGTIADRILDSVEVAPCGATSRFGG